MGFSRDRKPVRGVVLTVRVTEDEKNLLAALAGPLGVRGQSDVVRLALDFFLEKSPEAKAAAKKLLGK